MKKYLLLYTAPMQTREKMQSATPEEMKETMRSWMDWFEKVGDKLVDKGMSLSNAMTVTKEEIMPGNVEYVAYNVIQADDIDDAIAAAKMSPHLEREGGEVQIHEMMEMSGIEFKG